MEKTVKQAMTKGMEEPQKPKAPTLPVQQKEYLSPPLFVTYARPEPTRGSKLLNVISSIPLPPRIKRFFKGAL